jgi:hypothetical protein
MDFLKYLLLKPYPAHQRDEVNKLIDELVKIGRTDDYLSERPGGGYDGRCHHIRTRQIGKRLDEIGGHELMIFASKRVKKHLKTTLWEHLLYAWQGIGDWVH